MADSKLPALPELATTPDTTDLVYVVDVSDTTDDATGTSKKVTRTNLVGGLAASSHTHATADTTSGTFADARIASSNVTQHVGDIDHDSTLNTHDLTTDIDHNTITNNHDLTTDIDHATITNGHDLTTDIDHATITNNHNLTTDIDHDQLTNFEAGEHFTQAAITAVGTLASGNADAAVSASSTTTPGKIEIATVTETNTGTDATRAVSPDGLAGSNFGIRYFQVVAFDYTTDTATGDGAGYFHIPAGVSGMDLVEVHAQAITAGTTGTTDVQLYNLTQTADMLSTKLTIDSAETGSDTAATPAVIDTANDDVAENDLIRMDVDAVSTTAAKGLIVTMGFKLP